jgi:hypothetical protein
MSDEDTGSGIVNRAKAGKVGKRAELYDERVTVRKRLRPFFVTPVLFSIAHAERGDISKRFARRFVPFRTLNKLGKLCVHAIIIAK